jgi:peptide/nickel transport system permease protein
VKQPRLAAEEAGAFARVLGILKTLLKHKRGVFGFTVLSVFVIIAVFADVIAPHKPDEIDLAEGYAVPAWFKAFPQYRDLPENVEVVAEGRGWSVKCEGLTPLVSRNAVVLTVNGSRRLTATLERSFEYPYSPPKGFYGALTYNVTVWGAPGSSARIRLYLDAPGGGSYLLYDSGSIATNVSRTGAPATFDARDAPLKLALGFSLYDDLGEKLFSAKGTYKLRVVVYLNAAGDGGVSVAVGRLYFRIRGLAYGLLGTDNLGADIFSNLIYGTRVSLLVGILASSVSVSLGLIVGIVAGYKGGVVDQVLMFFTDTLMFIPLIPLLVAVSVFVGKSLYLTILLIALFSWMGFARNCRAYVMSLRDRLFVEAARALGASDAYIIFRHILPQLSPIVYVTLVLNVPGAILLEASLSFLNLGDPSVPSWGRMLYNARYSGAFSRLMWWWILPPGIMITLLAMSFVLIGQALDEILNPKLRARRLT